MKPQTLGTILIVEDDAELRFILAVHLRAAGFEVIEAHNGAEGLDCASQKPVDVIIMDVGLPVVDGLTATRRLKENPTTANIPVIMLTARTATNDVVKGLEAGAQEYLLKPFEVAELLARVRTVFRLASAHRDLDRINTQLEAEVDSKARRLQVLYEFMRDLNHAKDRDEILDLLMRCVSQSIGARRVSLFILNNAANQLICERALGLDPSQIPPMSVKEAQGITGQVFRTGKTLAAQSMGSRHEGTAVRATAEGARTRHEGDHSRNGTQPSNIRQPYVRDAFVSTPLITTSLQTRDGVIGVLNVTDKNDDTPFATEEIECIRSIADAAAIALDNVTRRVRLQQSVKVLLQTVGRLAEYRDEETTLHLERVSKFARVLAVELQRAGPYALLVTDEFIESLVQAAPLHDLGKVGIPDEILTKPGKLTDEEFQIMKSHTEIGRRVLSQALDPAYPVPLLQMCIEIAWCHHERFDGKGYPRRIKGQDIPLSARIISLVDAYDAITSRRRYKSAKTHAQAVDIIRVEANKHFDPAIIEAFLRCADKFDEVRERYEETELAEAATP
jgi:response regulator RpfG family c-di-GMP phosphodiesterase